MARRRLSSALQRPAGGDVIGAVSLIFLGCVDTFDKFDRSLAWGGVLQEGADTLAECQAICLTILSCTAVDFDTRLQGCFVHDETTMNQLITDRDFVAHYRRVPCAPSTTVPTSSPGRTSVPLSACINFESIQFNLIQFHFFKLYSTKLKNI